LKSSQQAHSDHLAEQNHDDVLLPGETGQKMDGLELIVVLQPVLHLEKE
jgi:hypothetical protein